MCYDVLRLAIQAVLKRRRSSCWEARKEYAHGMHTLCTRCAHIMHTVCTHYAHGMHTLCTWYAHIFDSRRRDCNYLIYLMHCVAVCCSMLQCVAMCCSVLQCVAVCCSVL